MAIVVFCWTGQSAYCKGSFLLTATKDTITVTGGDSVKIDIDVVTNDGFDDVLLMLIYNTTPDFQGGKAYLTNQLFSFPYKGLKLIIETKSFLTQSGLFTFTIQAMSSSVVFSLPIYVKVRGTIPPQNWRLLPEWKNEEKYSGNYNYQYVMQDSLGNYWNSHNGTHKEYKGTPLEDWNTNGFNFGHTYTLPVIDYSHNKVWLPTENGLIVCDTSGNNRTICDKSNSPFINSYITALARDSITNDLWVGDDYGLYRLSGSTWTMFDTTDFIIKNEPVTSIHISGSTIWIGTLNGLVKFDGKNWTRLTKQNSSIPDSIVIVKAVEANGDVWLDLRTITTDKNKVQTQKIEIAKFDGTTWTIFNKLNSPIDDSVHIGSIAIDKKGNKWMSTSQYYENTYKQFTDGRGIFKFDNVNWTIYSDTNSPLPNNRINQLSVDNFDNVWFHSMPLMQSDTPSEGYWGVFNENGKPLAFTVTGVDEMSAAISDGISIYPNPSSTNFIVSGIEGVASLRVVNSVGVEVMNIQIVGDKQAVDISSLPSGLYFVKVRSSSGIVVKPVVVNR